MYDKYIPGSSDIWLIVPGAYFMYSIHTRCVCTCPATPARMPYSILGLPVALPARTPGGAYHMLIILGTYVRTHVPSPHHYRPVAGQARRFYIVLPLAPAPLLFEDSEACWLVQLTNYGFTSYRFRSDKGSHPFACSSLWATQTWRHGRNRRRTARAQKRTNT